MDITTKKKITNIVEVSSRAGNEVDVMFRLELDANFIFIESEFIEGGITILKSNSPGVIDNLCKALQLLKAKV